MEVWLALVGSSLPLRGEPHASIGRPSPFLRRFRGFSGSLVEDKGRMLVPGPPTGRHAFIAVADAARACVEATQRSDSSPGPLDVAGPEVLSWVTSPTTFSAGARPAGCESRRRPGRCTPCASVVLRPFGGAPSAHHGPQPLRGRARDGRGSRPEVAWSTRRSMTTVEALLRAKHALDPALPEVP